MQILYELWRNSKSQSKSQAPQEEEVEEKPPLTKFQRKIAIGTVIGLMIYSGINLYLVIAAYVKLDSNIGNYGEIIDNWETKTILDIIVDTSCPLGYEKVFAGVKWPGTGVGCYCGQIDTTLRLQQNVTCSPFCEGACYSAAIAVGCSNVPAHESKLLNYWGSRDGKYVQICVKRSKETWTSIAPLSADECPTGYKKCGSGNETAFCTKESQCPITSIKVTKTPLDSVGSCVKPNCLILDTGADYFAKKLEISRSDSADVVPLSQFRLNEYDMCDDVTQDNVTPARTQYYLLKKKLKSCSRSRGQKWEMTDETTENNLFDVNGLTPYISSLDNYGGYYGGYGGSSYYWGMFTRNYIPFNVSCRDRMQDLVDKRIFVDHVSSAQLALLIVGSISTVFLGLVLSFLEYQNLNGYDIPCIKGKGEEERTKLKKLKKVINYVFKGVQFPFQIWAIILTGTTTKLFNEVAGKNCSNDDTNSILSLLAENLAGTLKSNLIALGTLLASVALDIILAKILKKKEEKPHEEVKVEKDESFMLVNNQSNIQINDQSNDQIGMALVKKSSHNSSIIDMKDQSMDESFQVKRSNTRSTTTHEINQMNNQKIAKTKTMQDRNARGHVEFNMAFVNSHVGESPRKEKQERQEKHVVGENVHRTIRTRPRHLSKKEMPVKNYYHS